MMKKITCFLTLLILFSTGVLALSYPHAFYGSVTYSNGSQINDLSIKAILGSFQDTSQITNSKYGENQDTLIVEAESEGGLIQFYISNQQNPIGNYTFKKFEIIELNFIIPAPQNQNNSTNNSTPAPPNGGSSSSSSSSSSSGGGGSSSRRNNIDNTIVLNPQNTTNQSTYSPNDSTKINSDKTNTLNLNQQNTESRSPGITGAVIGSNINTILITTTLIIAIIAITSLLIILKKHKQ